MGGEGDATNIIPSPLCAVFASISLDHLGILGNSIEEIARTKAGIIKPGCQVISAPQPEEAALALKEAARQKGCTFHQVDDMCIRQVQESWKGQTIDYREQKGLYLPLPGGHQAINAAVALETLDSLRKQGLTIPEGAIQEGLKKVQWFGRFTCLMESPWFFIDGAHNPAAARCLAGTVHRCFTGKRLILIMGVFRDKEYEEIAKSWLHWPNPSTPSLCRMRFAAFPLTSSPTLCGVSAAEKFLSLPAPGLWRPSYLH